MVGYCSERLSQPLSLCRPAKLAHITSLLRATEHQRDDWKRHKHECFGPTWWDDPDGIFPEEEKVGRG